MNEHEFIIAVDGIYKALRSFDARYQNYIMLNGALVSFFSIFNGSDDQVNVEITQEDGWIVYSR